MFFVPASPSSVLAFVTTIHLGLAALRNHRSAGERPFSALTLVSLALAATPWMFPSAVGLALGGVVHLLWFVACELPGRRTHASEARAQVPGATSGGGLATAPAPRGTGSSSNVSSASVPKGFVQTPVLATFDETPDIRTIRLLRPDAFTFEAGQFIPVRVRVDGKEYVRCYSISSAPHSTGFLEVSIKRQGLVSNALHSTARPGAILSIKAPNGAFRYPTGDDRPIVLLAAGVGITPLISMLRHAVHSEPSRPVTLVYSAVDAAGFAFRDELQTIARRHPQTRVVYTLTRQPPPSPAFYPGRIDAALLQTAVPDLAHSISFICGPLAMIESMKSLLTQLGVPASQIRHEVFEAAVAAAAGARGGGKRLTDGAAHGGGDVAASQMRCLPDDLTVRITPGQSLLEAAEHAGVEIPSLCRAGVCGTCRVRVTEGTVSCESTTLDAADLAQGYVLACVAQARSDCTVQL